jgi:serine/threonine protein kinase
MLSSTADAAAPPTIRDLHDILSLHDAPAKSPISTSLDLGTAPYSAPELFADNVVVSYPSDVFSLGVTLWEMLTLRAPYAGKRTVETMLGVRRGMFWQIHERDRIARIGDGDMTSIGTDLDVFAGVRRAGSLRIPGRERRSIRSPLLSDVQRFNSRSSGELAQLPITVERQLRKMADTAERVSPDQPAALHYSDGSPAMLYPNGYEHVEERLRDLIRRSVDPDLSRRPVAMEVVHELYSMY